MSVRSSVIERLFPPEVAVVVASGKLWDEPLRVEEEEFVRTARAKRRREFSAGRACARAAMERLGVEAKPVPVGANRVPLWPSGLVGSITHCEGFCAAAATSERFAMGLGVDAEPAEPLPGDITDRVCTPAELDWIAGASPPAGSDWARIVFSAKESVFKCHFPRAGRFFGFLDVEVQFDPTGGSFHVVPKAEHAQVWPDLRRVGGRFIVSSTHVLTSALLPAGPCECNQTLTRRRRRTG
jgi:4'-phosphopantetheinyl transferase EntD